MDSESPKVAVLPGDGIGPEVTAAALRVLAAVRPDIVFTDAPIGAAAIEATGDPLPAETVEVCEDADAILFGAVGLPEYDDRERHERPEQALLDVRRRFDLFANIRPAFSLPFTRSCSPLRESVCAHVDVVIVRELLGGLYYGDKRVFRNHRAVRAVDTLEYSDSEVQRIALVAFELARSRRRSVTSVDKQNVLATSRLWRETVQTVAQDFPDVSLRHMLVDTAAMELTKRPADFDVLVTENTFGDILSDQAGAIVGSIGVLPSASIGARSNTFSLPFGLYEPISGSAPNIAGTDRANPTGAILSAALLLRHSVGDAHGADRIHAAVIQTYAKGWATKDITAPGYTNLGTCEFTEKVLAQLA